MPVPVRTGEEALQVLHAQRGIAAALIDGLLPDMHGVRLADAILDSPKGQSVAICFVSGAVHDPKAGEKEINRLYAVESTPSITGAVADHRRAAPPVTRNELRHTGRRPHQR